MESAFHEEDPKMATKSKFKATPENIWGIPVYLPYLQPKLTPKRLETAEKELGYKLPKELVEILQVQNGGYIRFSIPDLPHSLIAGIGPHYPSLDEDYWSDLQEFVSFSLEGLIPLDGDGHWFLCLDYRKNTENPCITFIDIDANSQKKIAKDFAGYLKLLKFDYEDQFVLNLDIPIEDFLVKLSSKLKTPMDKPDTFSSGYPIYRFPLGKKRKPEWLWITPNLVPLGFVREGNARYETLKKQMKGKGKRYPFLPENCYLVSITSDVNEKVLAVFESLNYPLVKIG